MQRKPDIDLIRIFYQAGAILTAGVVAGAGAINYQNYRHFQQEIKTANAPITERVTQCQAENRQCMTDHATLYACLQRKADARDAIIDNRAFVRNGSSALMGFSSLYLVFLIRRAREQAAAKPPQLR